MWTTPLLLDCSFNRLLFGSVAPYRPILLAVDREDEYERLIGCSETVPRLMDVLRHLFLPGSTLLERTLQPTHGCHRF